MYAVIRAGGKQYRVAPGDVVRMEKLAAGDNGQVQFDVLAVAGSNGEIGPAQNAQVTGQVVDEGRGGKILVFHYKRKKQYKKLQGHRQAFSAVRITEINVDGQSFSAPELPARAPKKVKPAAVEAASQTGAAKSAKKAKPAAKKAKSAGGKTAKPAAKKSAGKSAAKGAKKK
ncbi:MAG: 50S ribosomal protein L21 [Candidatus Korobacteraceae bacterium]